MGLRARLNRRSIEARVLILQGAGWLTLLLLVTTTTASSARQLAHLATEREQQLADVVANQIDREISNDLARVQALSGSTPMTASGADLPAVRVAVFEAFHRATLIESIRLVAQSGVVLAQEPVSAADLPISHVLLRDVLDAGRIRSTLVSRVPLRAEILLPLRGQEGEVDAVASVLLSADARIVTELLARADVDLVATDAAAGPVRAPLSIAPWSIVAASHQDQVPPLAWRTLRWSLPLTLSLALLFAWGTARSVRRPVLALTAAAERMAAGNLDTPLPAVPAGDEIDRLARVLERMRLALHRDAWRQQTLRKVITAQEEERRRIARELHDDTAQALAAVGVSLEAALDGMPVSPARWRLESLKTVVNESLTDLHRVIYDLRPSVLDDLGLVAAIRWLADEHLRRTGVMVRVEGYGLDERLPSDIETAIFRVVQEALANIERHAAAETVLLQVSRDGNVLTVEIEDDGKGFEPATVDIAGGSGRGLGLQGMRERVELLGGTFTLTSAPGRGTRVAVTVPL